MSPCRAAVAVMPYRGTALQLGLYREHPAGPLCLGRISGRIGLGYGTLTAAWAGGPQPATQHV